MMQPDLYAAYAEMSQDKQREKEGAEWVELAFKDVDNEKVRRGLNLQPNMHTS